MDALERTEPCACGGSITVRSLYGGPVSTDAIADALRRHYATAQHRLWSARWRWATEIPSRVLDERIPTGAELRR